MSDTKSHLSELALEGCRFDGRLLFERLKASNSLRTLQLHKSGNTLALQLADSLEHMKSLRSLKLFGVRSPLSVEGDLANAMSKNWKLEELTIAGMQRDEHTQFCRACLLACTPKEASGINYAKSVEEMYFY